MNRRFQQAWRPWTIIGFLFVLCGVLAFLQNRWLKELSDAEDARFHRDLQADLERFQYHFDDAIKSAIRSLAPDATQIADQGIVGALSLKAAAWKSGAQRYFSRVALASVTGDQVRLLQINPGSQSLNSVAWPSAWYSTLGELRSRLSGHAFGPPHSSNPSLLEIPLSEPGSTAPEQDFLLLQLDLDYLRRNTIPQFLALDVNTRGQFEYEAEVTSDRDPTNIIFQTSSGKSLPRSVPDASVGLLQIEDIGFAPPPAFAPERRPLGAGVRGPPGPPPGLWRLTIRYKPGSLEGFIVRARLQSAAVSAVLLGLILATGSVLVQSSRNAQRLADIQFNFVAGISHELRTPVTVIRTAAYNLHGDIARRPDQVERYGDMIRTESERLSALLEQVLLFGSARTGNLVRVRDEIAVEDLIEQSVSDCCGLQSDVVIEHRVDPGLPRVWVDRAAIQQALSNLLTNGIKYGTSTSKWVGIFASASSEADVPVVEIRVADRGPGIPVNEQKLIFEPFFRGNHPVRDRVHGTGLGLSLVRSIMEAHGGSVSVRSEAASGTEFVIRLPVRAQV